YAQMVRLAITAPQVQELFEKTKAPKRRAILARLLQIPEGEAIPVHRLAEEAGTTPPTVRKLARLKIISITSEPEWNDLLPPTNGQSTIDHTPIQLNDDQQRVMAELSPRIDAQDFS